MIYFSDFFNIDPSVIESYGAFNISLINDLPLFIDPFLLFSSDKPEYQKLHNDMLTYMAFLKSKANETSDAQIKAWYMFPEVKQNWFGYSVIGNGGRGLGKEFGQSLCSNLDLIFDDLGNEKITKTSHLEKACLFESGVGRDNVSDFTTNLIYSYLLEYTQEFTLKNIDETKRREFGINKVYFNYELERWMPKKYTLPVLNNDFIILTPKSILTKDENWISRKDLDDNFIGVYNSIDNSVLRFEIDNYFRSNLPAPNPNKKPNKKEIAEAITKVLHKYPVILNYYIKKKENNKKGAKDISQQNVSEIEELFISNVLQLVDTVFKHSDFYKKNELDTYSASKKRVEYLKQVIENNDGYKLFYVKGVPVKREADLQIIFRLTWFASKFDVNSETNNGRGPVDYKISDGSKDKTLVEFKLASNSKLKRNLEKQVEIYESANQTKKSLKVILYFDAIEYSKIMQILNELNLQDNENIFLIDASGNKPSASNA